MWGPLSILLGTLVWLAFDPHALAPRVLLAGASLTGVVAGVYAVPATASSRLNRGLRAFSPDETRASGTALVLLSGRVETIRGADGRRSRALTPSCAARVREAARVWTLIGPDWIVSAGGLVRPVAYALPAAALMRDRLIELGVPPATLAVESTSRDTHQSAVNAGAMLRRLKAERVILVTSAVHMRRAMGAFRAEGFEPIGAPAPDPERPPSRIGRLLPSRSGLRFSAEVLHEAGGILYYRLRGWYRA